LIELRRSVPLIRHAQAKVNGRERLLIGSAAFFALGLPTGAMGVLWPSVQRSLGVPLGALGLVLAVWTMGYFAGGALSGAMVAHAGLGNVLTLTSLLAAVGLLEFATASTLFALVVAVAPLGIGSGVIGAAVNAHVAVAQRVRWMGVIHTSWALGAAAGPVAVVLATRLGAWQLASVGIAIVFGLVSVVARWRRADWTASSPTHTQGDPSSRRRLNGTVTLAVLGAAFIYVGLECSTGQWAYTRLFADRELRPLAGLSISLYWTGLAAGRAGLAAFGHKCSAAKLLNVSAGATCLGTACFWLLHGGLGPLLGLPFIGLGLSVFLPLLFSNTSQLCGERAEHTVGYQNAAGTAGGTIVPGATGILMQGFGVTSLNPWLVCLAACMTACHLVALVAGSRRQMAPASTGELEPAHAGEPVASGAR
jgi:fucose permease